MNTNLRVLVTGGAGFIGSHLVERLLGMGCKVRVLDNLSKGSIDNLAQARGAELVIGDILDHDVVCRAVKDIDVVFHLAALTSVAESMSDPARYHDICGNGTRAVLRLAAFAGVRRFVYAASSSCYGDAGESPIPESATLAPQSPYAEAKIAGEGDCVDASTTGIIETVRLRFFNVYGPRQDPRGSYAGVICAFVDAVQHGRPLTIYGDGEQTRDFVHVTDVARALASAGWQPGINGRVFNIGTGTRTSLRALASAVGEAGGEEVIPVHAPGRGGDVRHSCADVTAARESLGFTASVDLAGGLGGLLHVGHRHAA
jgi:UDP-glucose 4-epimerase